MKKKFKCLTVILLALFAGCSGTGNIKTALSVASQSQKIRGLKIGIISGSQTLESIAFSDMFATEMLGAGFRVIERNRIEAALEEQKLSLSGVLEKSDFAALNKIVNLDAVFIFMAKYDGEKIQSCVLKLVDVKTGEVLLSTNYRNEIGQGHSGRDMVDTVSDIARSINSQLRIN